MDFLETLKGLGIDPIIVLLIFAGGYWSKTYINWTYISITVPVWKKTFKTNLTNAWKTLIIGSIFVAIYFLILLKIGSFEMKKDLLKGFYSYVIATSFYELLLKHVIDFLESKFGKKDA